MDYYSVIEQNKNKSKQNKQTKKSKKNPISVLLSV